MEGKFKMHELSSALKQMKKNKAPGCSGLTMEIFVVFFNDIKDVLLDALKYAYEIGHLHNSALWGIIMLIPKPKHDTQKIETLRLITLLNLDYKLVEKMLANRLKPALEDIINHDQKGFLRNRHIGYNIRKIIDILDQIEDEDSEGIILSIDFRKCFDLVETSALIEALKFFGAGESFIRWTKLIYTDAIAAISNNGILSKWFRVTRSVKQGRPNSAYYFLVIAEVLAIQLRKNPNISGIMMNQIRKLLGQFADDMDLYMKNLKDCEEALKVITNIRTVSGFQINYDKTTLYRLGSLKNSDAEK